LSRWPTLREGWAGRGDLSILSSASRSVPLTASSAACARASEGPLLEAEGTIAVRGRLRGAEIGMLVL